MFLRRTPALAHLAPVLREAGLPRFLFAPRVPRIPPTRTLLLLLFLLPRQSEFRARSPAPALASDHVEQPALPILALFGLGSLCQGRNRLLRRAWLQSYLRSKFVLPVGRTRWFPGKFI